MREYVLVTDSTIDLPDEMLKEIDIEVIRYTFTIEDKNYENYADWREMSSKEFYDLERAGHMPKTSQINVSTFINYFEQFLKEGKDVIYVCFSSALSGTYNSANLAMKTLRDEYPQAKIETIDSKSACMGQGLLVYQAALMKKQGYDFDQLKEWILEFIPKTNHWFTVDDINHLKRGGRLSNASAFVAKMLKIKPFMFTNDNGELHVVKKCIGRKSAINSLYEKIISKPQIEGLNTVLISHSDCLDEANYLADCVKKALPEKNIIVNVMGPIIGSHTGPGTLAIFFFSDDRN